MDDRTAVQGLGKASPRGQRAAAGLLAALAVALGSAAADAQPVVYVASSGSNSVTAIDGSTMVVKGNPVPVGAQPTALAVTPDGRIVLATVFAKKDGERVVVIDAVRNQKQRFWKPFGPPIGVAIEPQVRSGGRRIAHVLVKDGPFGPGISQFNLKRMVWIHFIRGRRNPKLMAVTPDGSRIYVPGTDKRSGRAFLTEFNFFFGSGQSHTGLSDNIALAGGNISAFGITPDSRFVIVVSQDASGGIVNAVDRANGNHVDAQNLGGGIVPHDLAIGRNASGIFGLLTTDQALVQLSASGTPTAVTANSSLFLAGFIPDKVTITPDGTVAYVTNAGGPSVARLPVSKGVGTARLVRLPDGTPPTALVMSADGKFVFVTQGGSTGGVVSRIDVTSNEVKSVAVQGQPVVLAVGPAAPTSSNGSPCPDGSALCGDKCVSLAGDPANCGGCGRACPAGDVCTSGRCECPRGREICGDACLDVTTNRANCGRCGRVCIPGDVCVSGQCVCPAGQNVCSDRCVNETTDRRNCGHCGNVCPPDEVCSAGRCTCPPAHELCNGVCTETQTSVANCGRCGRACIPGDVCVSGNCVCPAGRNVCSGQCVNLDVNLRNCGTCGRVCLPGDICVSGRCTCPDGHKVCRNVCVDVETDTSNCGTCGHVCAAGQKCVGGRCG